MKQLQLQNLTVGEIVANDFRMSTLFKNAGIDFCCGGNQLFSEACIEHNIDAQQLENEIIKIGEEPQNEFMNFKNWDPVFLSEYIVNTHHKFVMKNLPELVFYTQKIADVHADNHPELIKVSQLFQQINNELLQHLSNEEEVLFPAIKEVISNGSVKAKETIVSEITRMSKEHDFAGGAMDEINKLTKNYAIPNDACNTYKVAFKMLEQFEDDLHIHVHLENNILFPKALDLAN
ncbi:MAG: iron-sulfur cluster repair di-iron protein [Prolixibacteraceae bacterium]|nr:iron-sulfur cluster repair di-iron protein [Prolixibacteraceae bacterium]